MHKRVRSWLPVHDERAQLSEELSESHTRASIDLVFVPSYSMEMLSEEARMTLGFM